MASLALLVIALAVGAAGLLVVIVPDLAETLLLTQTILVRLVLIIVAVGLLATGHYAPAAGIIFSAALYLFVSHENDELPKL